MRRLREMVPSIFVTCPSTHRGAQPSASVEAGVSLGFVLFFLLDFRSMTAAAWSVKPQWTRLLRLWKSWQGSTNLKPSSGLPAEPDNCSGQMWGEANSAFFVNNYKWTACACSGDLLKPWRRNGTSAELIGTSLQVVRKAFFSRQLKDQSEALVRVCCSTRVCIREIVFVWKIVIII